MTTTIKSPSTHCPNCSCSLALDDRYPHRFCGSCFSKAEDFNGEALQFSNLGASGGFKAVYARSQEPYRSNLCQIDNHICWASEHHMGGIVIEAMTMDPDDLTCTTDGRFALERGYWYALELFDDEFGGERRTSPVRVDEVRPKGGRSWELDFFHLDYPQGVQDKTYAFKTIHRGENYLIAVEDNNGGQRHCIFFAMTFNWFDLHYPHITSGRHIA